MNAMFVDNPIVCGYDYQVCLSEDLAALLKDSAPCVKIGRFEFIPARLHADQRTLMFRVPESFSSPFETICLFDKHGGSCLSRAAAPVFLTFACTYAEESGIRLRFLSNMEKVEFRLDGGEKVSWSQGDADPVMTEMSPSLNFENAVIDGRHYSRPDIYICSVTNAPKYLRKYLPQVSLQSFVPLTGPTEMVENDDNESTVFGTWVQGNTLRTPGAPPDVLDHESQALLFGITQSERDTEDREGTSQAEVQDQTIQSTQKDRSGTRPSGVEIEVDSSHGSSSLDNDESTDIDAHEADDTESSQVAQRPKVFSAPVSCPKECMRVFKHDVRTLGQSIESYMSQVPTGVNRGAMAEILFKTLAGAVFTGQVSSGTVPARGPRKRVRKAAQTNSSTGSAAAAMDGDYYLGVTFHEDTDTWKLCSVVFDEDFQHARVAPFTLVHNKRQRRYVTTGQESFHCGRDEPRFILLEDTFIAPGTAPKSQGIRLWHELHEMTLEPKENQPYTKVQMRHLLMLAKSAGIEYTINGIEDVMNLYEKVVNASPWNKDLESKAKVDMKMDRTSKMMYYVRLVPEVSLDYGSHIKRHRAEIMDQASSIFKMIKKGQKKAKVVTSSLEDLAEECGEDVSNMVIMTPYCCQ